MQTKCLCQLAVVPPCFSPYMSALGLLSFPVTAHSGVEQLLTSRFLFARSDVNFYIKYSGILANCPVLPLQCRKRSRTDGMQLNICFNQMTSGKHQLLSTQCSRSRSWLAHTGIKSQVRLVSLRVSFLSFLAQFSPKQVCPSQESSPANGVFTASFTFNKQLKFVCQFWCCTQPECVTSYSMSRFSQTIAQYLFSLIDPLCFFSEMFSCLRVDLMLLRGSHVSLFSSITG